MRLSLDTLLAEDGEDLLEQLLTAELARVGEPAMIAAVQEAVERWVGPLATTWSRYLRAQGNGNVRGCYQRAVRPASDKVDVRELVRLIRLLRLPLTTDSRYLPWCRVPEGSTAVVVMGVHPVQIAEVSTAMSQQAVGGRDVRAYAALTNHFHHDFRLNCRVELHLPASDRAANAEALLTELTARRDVGLIAVIGSPVTNPLADPIARRIMGPVGPGELDARFRWGRAFDGSYLSEPGSFPKKHEGVRARGDDHTTYPRDPDDVIANAGAGPFRDAGVLLIGCDSRQVLLLAAGHGGAGTEACVHALRQQATIAELLHTSFQLHRRRRLFALIQAEKQFPSARPRGRRIADDLVLARYRFAHSDTWLTP